MTVTTRGQWRLSARQAFAAGAAAVLVAALTPAGVAHAAETFNRGTARACPANAQDAFADDDGTVHEDNINCIAHWEIAQGYADGTYRPSLPVNRAQMATYIVNEMTVAGYTFAANPDDAFTDDDGNVHEGDINKLAAAGVVKGDGNGHYNPGQVVNRAQMASYINQAVGVVTGTTPTSDTDYFGDDDGSVHEDNINALASLGIVQGDGQGSYLPGEAVRRAPMATFVARSGDYLAEQGHWPSPNALDTAYQPTPSGPDTLTFAEVREYQVEVPEGTKVNVALFPAGDVTISSRSATFHDTATPTGVADLGATNARIIAVNGSRVTDTQQVNDATGFGTTLSVAVQSTADADIVPVFWTDTQGGTDNALDLDSSDQAAEPVGVGGEGTWSLTEAATGSSTPVVQGIALGVKRFATTNGQTFAYDSSDTFQFKSQNSTMADFAARLSVGDVLAISYDRNGPSTFNITQDVTEVPDAPIAVAVDGPNNDDVADYVGLLFTLPYGNNPATSYTLQRQNITNPINPSGSCDGATTPASDSWDDVTTLPDGTTSYTDGPLTDGCYVYRILETTPVDQAEKASDNSDQVATGGTIDDTPPTIDTATVTADNTAASDCANADAADSGQADACDVHRFTFSENMLSEISTGWYRVSDADGTIADIVCENNADKDANATCSYSDAVDAPAPFGSPATLTVTLTAEPTIVQAGSTPGLQYPGTVVSVSSSWQDTAGNHVTFQGSDRVLEVNEG